MGKPTGFIEYTRELPPSIKPQLRIKNHGETTTPLPIMRLQRQAARCMDCGVPFCHNGCPLGNVIPDWNDFVYTNQWKRAFYSLSATNNFPEITGRICPAICEESCTLGLNDSPVTIRNIERTIVDRAVESDFLRPRPPVYRTGKTVAVVGSGPAGLACADQLNRAGHYVSVFERADRIGGLLRYGIPDFKLPKIILDHRLAIMTAEGVNFVPNADIGVNKSVHRLLAEHDAVVLCCGATVPRNLPIPGRNLDGVNFAMEFLVQQNRRNANDNPLPRPDNWWFVGERKELLATGKNVIVIGGGDTGSDCVGTCNRQNANSINQFELLPKPPVERTGNQPWPQWPNRLRTSSSHEEGCNRVWNILTKKFLGENGKLTALETIDVEWKLSNNGLPIGMHEIPGTERTWPADMVFLALGFLGPETNTLISELHLDLDKKGNVITDENYRTSTPKVFTCGDMRRGQSLVVWAIKEGRSAAHNVDRHLMGSTSLPA